MPVGGGKYELGIMTSTDRMRSDLGHDLPALEAQSVGNASNYPYLVDQSDLQEVHNWLKLLRSSVRCPSFGTQFLYGVWATATSLARINSLPTPKIVITDRMEPGHLGSYWNPSTSRGKPYKGGLIEISNVRFYTYQSLVGTLLHEVAHQIEWFSRGETDHGTRFKQIAQHLSNAIGGVKIPQDVDTFVRPVLPPPHLAKHPVYYLLAELPGKVKATWSDSKSEVEQIALHLDPDLQIELYETRDSSLLDWIGSETDLAKFATITPEMVKRIKTNKRIY